MNGLCYWSVMLIGAFALTVVCGCDRGGGTLYPVEGTVTIDGRPAANILIQFHPVEWTSRGPVRGSSAISDADGRFALNYATGLPGVPLGRFKVICIDNDLAVEDEPDVLTPHRAAPNRVPTAYYSAVTTPLEIEVVADQRQYEIIIHRQ